MKPELRLGRWQHVMNDVTCDVLICDPPYSRKTHAGYMDLGGDKHAIEEYSAMSKDDCVHFASRWHYAIGRWALIFGDHITHAWHSEAWERAGWYVFAPVVIVKSNPTPRFSGDGPCSACEYLMVARRKDPACFMGHKPGYYLIQKDAATAFPGVKPLALMRALVRDYSRPGDVICDPFAGSGTTLLAAAMEGRRSIGSEMDEGRYAIAVEKIRNIQGSLL